MNKNIFITGIGTGIGKTVVSAIFVKATGRPYWKPVQCGDLNATDSMTISKMVPSARIIKSAVSLTAPLSPHAAAKLEGFEIRLDDFNEPQNKCIIEGAGGVLVPLNENDSVLDLAEKLQASLVIVSQYYLGSINHTLLTINEVKRRGFHILGIVFNGFTNPESKNIILSNHPLPVLLEVNQEENMNEFIVERYANILWSRLNEL